jgi:metal-dependent amidase/aminoacylase/carboxypeptidase family protein
VVPKSRLTLAIAIAIARISRDLGTMCADVNHTGGKVIGLRADMDALPIEEATGAPLVFG